MKIEKNIKPPQNTVNKEAIIESRKDLKESILQRVERKVEEQFSDQSLDRERLKIELRSGVVLDLDKLEFVTNVLQIYEKRFPQEYYHQIFRLNRHRGSEWQIPESGIISKKPHLVGKWTKEIIYSRFGKHVLPVLETYNPYISVGLRKYKHHQFLDEDGLEKLDQFISESIMVMENSDNWYEFRIKLYEKHGVPYQLDIYEEKSRSNLTR